MCACWMIYKFPPTLDIFMNSMHRQYLVIWLLGAFVVSLGPGYSALRISEFQAKNLATLNDEQLTSSDWIEIHNDGDAEVNLQGYYLTDDPENLDKWVFPSLSVAPGKAITVFASGKDQHTAQTVFQRDNPIKPTHTNFRLSSSGDYLALVQPDGTTIEHDYGPQFPRQMGDVSYGISSTGEVGYFKTPTPGALNGNLDLLGPYVSEVTNVTGRPVIGETDTMIISAWVQPNEHPIAEVTLFYRFMFKNEVAVEMKDDGASPDEVAEDGVFTASFSTVTLFGSAIKPGEMARWRIEAKDDQGSVFSDPWVHDPEDADIYYGTVAIDPSIDTKLPVLHRFFEQPSRAENVGGTRGAIFYEDTFGAEFYDNVFVRIRGGTATSWPKKAYKIELNEDHEFQFDAELPRVTEFDQNTTYTDKSYCRAILTTEFHQDSGTHSPITFPIRVQQNGEFYSVSLYVEQPDKDFLRRGELDTEGVYYKANPGSFYNTVSPFEKKTRRYESGKDDVQAFIDGLKLTGDERERFLFDVANLPAQINFMAGVVITQNIDASDKNHFLYRDTRGTGEWFMTPWDLDLTFGPDALNTDRIMADGDDPGNRTAINPLLGSRQVELGAGKHNDYLDRLMNNARTKAMFFRRIRSLTDQYLASDYFTKRLDELVELMEPDVELDRERWGTSAHFSGRRDSMRDTVGRIKTEYLEPRLAYLQSGAGVGVPDPQPEDPEIIIDHVEYNPASGNQDEEYIKIINRESVAIDISGWTLTGGIAFTFKPGTVIPGFSLFSPGSAELYLVKDVPMFRARQEEPTGGQGLFVQGNYQNHLSNFGEELLLRDTQGNEIHRHSYEGEPSLLQEYLVISEILYLPTDESGVEFVELLNTGTVPLELSGARFTQGIDFDFAKSGLTRLEPSARLLIVSDLAAFESVYGMGLPVAGAFANGTRLNNGGERLKLEDATNSTIAEISYKAATPWPEVAAGQSIVFDERSAAKDNGSSGKWAASAEVGGSPGLPGNRVESPRVIEVGLRLEHSPQDGLSLIWNSELGQVYQVQGSADLTDWVTADLPSFGGTGDSLAYALPKNAFRFYRLFVSRSL